jgi:hypothetical protein
VLLCCCRCFDITRPYCHASALNLNPYCSDTMYRHNHEQHSCTKHSSRTDLLPGPPLVLWDGSHCCCAGPGSCCLSQGALLFRRSVYQIEPPPPSSSAIIAYALNARVQLVMLVLSFKSTTPLWLGVLPILVYPVSIGLVAIANIFYPSTDEACSLKAGE